MEDVKLKRRVFCIWIVFLFCSAIFFNVRWCWAADAIVLDVNGKVELSSNDQTTLINTGQVLHANDQLKSQGGTARIMFSDGRVLMLEAGGTLQIAIQAKPARPDSVAAKIIKSLGEVTQESQGPTRKAMVRKGVQRIPVIHPCNTAIFPGELTFTWNPFEKLHSLHLALKSLSPPSSYSFSIAPGADAFTLSPDTAKLKPGIKYYWKLTGSDSTGSTYNSRTCWFTILSDEQVATLQKEVHAIENMKDMSTKERDLLTATLYLAYKLYDRVYPLLEAYPDDPGMQNIFEKVQEIRR